ncbi:TIGR01777 family oxidoreductase [Sungkyunkwania multivorans]|uniref:TIGR01777 family oxidoreductase n=1 Tax=Sungkyunkwania multivorans TaxID=1173618 RepID=A0ABW3D184_9FLAO
MNNIVIAAGTGFLGKVLTSYFKDKVETIIILTRGKTVKRDNVQFLHWDAKTLGDWSNALNDADALINLAGKSVDCRYNEKNKKDILTSRVDSTRILSTAIDQCTSPPKVWLNSSTATIYRHSTDKQMDEYKGEIGDDFSMNVAKSWERAFFEAENSGVRKVALRTSIVLGKDGGAFVPIKKLTQFGLGGKQGDGHQKVSWLHELDFARAIEFIIEKKSIEGVINLVAPRPTDNKTLMKVLRKSLGMPIGIPTPEWLLHIGARIIRTEPELVLKSRNVIPRRLQEAGFEHSYPNLELAIRSLTKN